jgi:hypothetical protein
LLQQGILSLLYGLTGEDTAVDGGCRSLGQRILGVAAFQSSGNAGSAEHAVIAAILRDDQSMTERIVASRPCLGEIGPCRLGELHRKLVVADFQERVA